MANADPVGGQTQSNEQQDSRGVEHPDMAPGRFGGDGKNSTKGGGDAVFLFGTVRLQSLFLSQAIKESLFRFRLGEPGTGIRNVNDDRAPGAQQRGAHTLARVVFAAVLDGVHEQFAEGNPDVVADLRGQVGQDLADVMGGPFHRLHAATELERHPLREGGEDAEIFQPGIGLQRLLNHVGQGGRGDWIVNVTISTVPEGADDLLGVGVSRNDHL